jgi:hypothetical protein
LAQKPPCVKQQKTAPDLERSGNLKNQRFHPAAPFCIFFIAMLVVIAVDLK